MFVIFNIVIKGGEIKPLQVHISKAGKTAHELERLGVKFTFSGMGN